MIDSFRVLIEDALCFHIHVCLQKGPIALINPRMSVRVERSLPRV